MTELISSPARPDDELADLLDLEEVDVGLFTSRTSGVRGGRLYGGETCAQALVAAERSVPAGFQPHSLHAYFLLGGETGVPVTYRVEHLRDGRTFHRRRVSATQDGVVMLSVEASFTATVIDAAQQVFAPMAPEPRRCRPLQPAPPPEWVVDPATAVDIRTTAPAARISRTTAYDTWFRFRTDVTDRVSAAARLTYISDYCLTAGVLEVTLGNGVTVSSLDHSVWFHAQPRLDDWLYYAKSVVSAGPARGLAEGRIFHSDGTLLASTAQEALIQVRSEG